MRGTRWPLTTHCRALLGHCQLTGRRLCCVPAQGRRDGEPTSTTAVHRGSSGGSWLRRAPHHDNFAGSRRIAAEVRRKYEVHACHRIYPRTFEMQCTPLSYSHAATESEPELGPLSSSNCLPEAWSGGVQRTSRTGNRCGEGPGFWLAFPSLPRRSHPDTPAQPALVAGQRPPPNPTEAKQQKQ